MRISDWSSDVSSSDLARLEPQRHRLEALLPGGCRKHREILAGAGEQPLGRIELDPADRLALVHVIALGRKLELRPGPRSEEHTSELQSLMRISYAVFCLKKNTIHNMTKK